MFNRLLKKNRKRSSKRKNNQVRKINTSKKTATRSKRYVHGMNYYPYTQKNYIFPSIIILIGFISLSFTIFLFAKQIEPFLKNERLKFLCTYQIGDKKNKSYYNAKSKLDKIVGKSDEFCKNFIFPKEKRKRRFNLMPIIKNIIFRFI